MVCRFMTVTTVSPRCRTLRVGRFYLCGNSMYFLFSLEPKTVLLKSIFKEFPDSLMGKPLWLGIHASTAGGMGLILVWGTQNVHAAWYSQKKKERSVSKRWRKHLSLIRIIYLWKENKKLIMLVSGVAGKKIFHYLLLYF